MFIVFFVFYQYFDMRQNLHEFASLFSHVHRLHKQKSYFGVASVVPFFCSKPPTDLRAAEKTSQEPPAKPADWVPDRSGVAVSRGCEMFPRCSRVCGAATA